MRTLIFILSVLQLSAFAEENSLQHLQQEKSQETVSNYEMNKFDKTEKLIEPILKTCKITNAIWEFDIFPNKITTSNNLSRKVGSAEFANGDLIEIEGNILDSNCVPIHGAIVEIWQADSNGNLFDQLRIKNMDPNFAYSGRAITDNLGNYHFYTIMPAMISEKTAPHINFRIRHSQFPTFETKMFFPDNNANTFDNTVKSNKSLIARYSDHTQEDSITYKFDITLYGVSNYKRI